MPVTTEIFVTDFGEYPMPPKAAKMFREARKAKTTGRPDRRTKAGRLLSEYAKSVFADACAAASRGDDWQEWKPRDLNAAGNQDR